MVLLVLVECDLLRLMAIDSAGKPVLLPGVVELEGNAVVDVLDVEGDDVAPVADVIALDRLVGIRADLPRQHEGAGGHLGIDLDLVLGLLGAEGRGHRHSVVAGVLVDMLGRVVIVGRGVVAEVPGPGHLIADVLLLVTVGYGLEVHGLVHRDEPGVSVGDDDVHAQGVGGTGAQQTDERSYDQ